MKTEKVVRSTCALCPNGCGVLIHVIDGKPTSIEGDLDSPISKGVLCIKGRAALEYLYHPDRLQYPLKRTGKRGSNKWERITWDDALDTIAGEFVRLKKSSGAESVVLIRGGARGLADGWLARFGNVFGTPNIASMAPYCFVPTQLASVITNGFLPFPDYEYPPACHIAWGSSSADCHIDEYEAIVKALTRGTRLMVVDPRKIGLCEKAEVWLRVRPGSDLALALSMIYVIINEGLYDADFVNRWTTGFDKLKAHVHNYSPEEVARIVWVDAETIRKAARLYATSKPASIDIGNGIEANINSFQTARAISILRAITGNLEVPGGDLKLSPTGILPTSSSQFDLRDKMPKEIRERRLSAGDKLLPIVFYALPQTIIKAVTTGKPYPIRAIYIQGANLLLDYPRAKKTYQALQNLEFIVASDMFMTPTVSMADIVLPVASFLEFDSIVQSPRHSVAQVQQGVAEIGECWSDYRMLKELAKRLELGDYFWDNDEQALDAVLKPAGLTFTEFRKIGAISGAKQYRTYEAAGFETPSRTVELYSSQLEKWDFDPLPVFREQPETPLSNPELGREYPLIFTSWKVEPYRHSGGRQITSLRNSHPEALVSIHPETAGKLGIREGDWIYIETRRGKIMQKATLIDTFDTRVIGVDYAWWFPEQGVASQYGWADSNVNVLTDSEPPYHEMGSANFRGILCKVYKVP